MKAQKGAGVIFRIAVSVLMFTIAGITQLCIPLIAVSVDFFFTSFNRLSQRGKPLM